MSKKPTKKASGSAEVSYCRIFPGIGIARLGDSAEPPFIGPEVPGSVKEPAGGYKDALGRMRKQAARFRIFAFSSSGENLGELTAGNAEIKWSVQLANKKADWWPFDGTQNVQHIMDHQKPRGGSPSERRNASLKSSEERAGLIISTQKVSLSGKDQISADMMGRFLDYPDPIVLGNCRTDDHGRLVVSGGNGRSDTVRGKDATFLVHYANNDWWFDDIADGPVEAEVSIGGNAVQVRGNAWILVAPPDFSPFTQNVVPLYQVMEDAAFDGKLRWPTKEIGPKPNDSRVSFFRDIYPILRRTSDYRWVNERAHRFHGKNRRADFASFDVLKLLADANAAKLPGSVHSKAFGHIRNPNFSDESIEARNQANLSFMPVLSGDEGSIRIGEPSRWLKLTKRQYANLEKWSHGDFINDFPETEEELRAIEDKSLELEDLPLSEQPIALIRAALEACEGGAFFPGIEVTSIVRRKDFYSEAFRVSSKTKPGDLTKWMALPWQADFNDCADNWWPAARPDDVVRESYFEQVLEEFEAQAEGGDLFELLVKREKWSKGIGTRYAGFEFGSMPGLPMPLDGMSAADYKIYAESLLDQFIRYFSWSIPSQRPNELKDSYLRRVRNFVSRSIGGAELDIEEWPPEEVEKKLEKFVTKNSRLGKPVGQLDTYVNAESDKSRDNPVMQGLFEIAWRIQDAVANKNEMVTAWSRLGVVTKKKTPSGETILVETGRKKYDLLPWREHFYYLMNIESYPDYMDKAKDLAEEFLEIARGIMNDAAIVGPWRTYFDYSENALDARLEAIYEENRRRPSEYNPAVNPGDFDTEEKIVERIRQLGPFNQLDGGWLQRAIPAGNNNKLQGLLFQIWSDELGNGDPAQNHANVYSNLMESAGLYYPPVKTRDYADNPDIWDGSFGGPVYHTAISLFPETYFPELLGMTLYLEWEANFLQQMVELYDYYGYSSLFYKLHVAIDNTVDGHGAMAKTIVKLYLDDIREESGERGVREHWLRIWTGYIAFSSVSPQRFRFHLNNPKSPAERVVEMIERKRHYGALSHHDKKLGMSRINALFDEPGMFLNELEASDHIVPGDPENSPFMRYLRPDGVMFRIFTKSEIELWKDWIRSLPAPADGAALDTGNAVVYLLQRMAARGIAAEAHTKNRLIGDIYPELGVKDTDGNVVTCVEESVTWWFQLLRRPQGVKEPKNYHAVLFMRALKDDRNKLIVPGKPEVSRLVTEFMRIGPMAEALRDTRPLLGGARGSEVLSRWIAENCPDPVSVNEATDDSPPALNIAAVASEKFGDPAPTVAEYTERLSEIAASNFPRESALVRRRRAEAVCRERGPGMGSVQ